MTGQMEYELAQVERGELQLNQYMAKVEQVVRDIVEELRQFANVFGKQPISLAPLKKSPAARKTQAVGKSGDSPAQANVPTQAETSAQGKTPIQADSPEILGVCPACGGGIIEGKKGYGCQNWRTGCKFVLWKTPICGKSLTKAQVKSLLKKGKTPLIKGFKSKSGKAFSAYLIWEDAKAGKIKFEFEEKS